MCRYAECHYVECHGAQWTTDHMNEGSYQAGISTERKGVGVGGS